jgi:hypothetical protein
MIHLMELPNPDPTELAARPEHGGRDRHMYAALAPGVSVTSKCCQEACVNTSDSSRMGLRTCTPRRYFFKRPDV